jgi:hypothetical protein
LFALVVLAAHENATSGGAYPVAELVRGVESLEDALVADDRAHGIDPGAGWLVRNMVLGMPRATLEVSEALLIPNLEQLSEDDREAVARLLGKLERGVEDAEAEAASRPDADEDEDEADEDDGVTDAELREVLSPEQYAEFRQARREAQQATRELVAVKREAPILYAIFIRPRRTLKRTLRRVFRVR